MRKIAVFGALLLTACVTINIYFPAAAAEKAADEIIKGIQKEDEPEETEPQSSLSDWQVAVFRSLDSVINVMVSQARAEDADLSINTPEIRQIRASMKSRFPSLKPYYSAGFVGIKADGMLAVRDAGAVPLQERNKVNKLVAADNTDRQRLYQAIANANGHPEWVAQIKSTFAARWINYAKPGWWYQSSNGSWKQKQ
jgi:uncharacterized protein YdbL (DUF1318 family)